MKCPVCKNHEENELHLDSDGFHEGIFECEVCGASWSVNHNLAEVIKDPQEASFLSATSEPVEADDYSWAS